MVKHKAWATTIVVPKLIGSMTTKGQMNPTFRVSLTASKAREKSQTKTNSQICSSNWMIMNTIFKYWTRQVKTTSLPNFC